LIRSAVGAKKFVSLLSSPSGNEPSEVETPAPQPLSGLDGPRNCALVQRLPKGLLDKLTREEILDLVAYVVARGDPKHPLFQGGHGHGHAAGQPHQH
jgi:hypothetical protein